MNNVIVYVDTDHPHSKRGKYQAVRYIQALLLREVQRKRQQPLCLRGNLRPDYSPTACCVSIKHIN